MCSIFILISHSYGLKKIDQHDNYEIHNIKHGHFKTKSNKIRSVEAPVSMKCCNIHYTEDTVYSL